MPAPMFASVALARRVEAGNCKLLRVSAQADGGQTFEVSGGLAVYAGPESPLTKVAGLGFAGPLDLNAWETVERAFAEHGCPLTVELPTLAESGIAEQLTRRGYVLVGFEDVLGRAVEAAESHPPAPEGLELAPSGDDELATWANVLVDGFLRPDDEGVASHESFGAEALHKTLAPLLPHYERFLGRRDGEPAAAASMNIEDGVVFLSGSATLPKHRRRGLQTALLRKRLEVAQARGATLATLTTLPGSQSAKNAHRQGFTPLYTRAILVREP